MKYLDYITLFITCSAIFSFDPFILLSDRRLAQQATKSHEIALGYGLHIARPMSSTLVRKEVYDTKAYAFRSSSILWI